MKTYRAILSILLASVLVTACTKEDPVDYRFPEALLPAPQAESDYTETDDWHLNWDNAIDGFNSEEELIEWYADCERLDAFLSHYRMRHNQIDP